MKITNFKSTQEYSQTLKKMEALVEEIIAGTAEESLWLLEHEDVYTAGTSADDAELLNHDFPVFTAGRGGKHTYHGPGQRVIYLMLDLKKHYSPPDLKKFVCDLEQWIIDSLKEIGVEAFRRKGRVGLWVEDKNSLGGEAKIAAIGIRVRKWVSFHGISININPILKNFDGIVPCGISEFGVTSLEKLGKKITMEEFDEILVRKNPFKK